MNIENIANEIQAWVDSESCNACEHCSDSIVVGSDALVNFIAELFAKEQKKLEGCVVVPSNSVTLTCEQLLTVLQYGAPDLNVERTEYSEEQMETEMSIVWLEDGHSGKGYYAYYTELPEEGSINLDLMEEAARGGNE